MTCVAACCIAALPAQAADTTDLIERLVDRIQRLEARIVALESQSQAARPVADAVVQADPPAEHADAESALQASLDTREQEQLIRSAFERTLIDRGGLLLPPWALEVEPSISYQNSSNDRIIVDGIAIFPVLVVGDIVSERIQRQQTTFMTTARLGLPGNLQLDLNAPFIYEEFQTVTAENDESIRAASGIGDVSVALSWQPVHSRGAMPDLVTALTWKLANGRSPFEAGTDRTIFGSGYESLDGRVTAVKVIDPLVYYGGVNYTRNFSTREDVGRFSPGDSVGFNIGFALALNLYSSISMSYEQLITGHSRLDGVELPGSNSTTGILSVGGSYSGDAFALDFSVGTGVTSDSPDVLVRFALPLRTQLR